MKCPICEKEMNLISEDYLDGHLLLEKHYECVSENHSKYNYSYAFGSTLENIGAYELKTHYNDSEDKIGLYSNVFKLIVDFEKNNMK